MLKSASVQAHQFLTDLIDAGAIPPAEEVVAVARSETHGLQVVVSITKFDGPARLHFAGVNAPSGFSSELPKCPNGDLTPLQARIVETMAGQTTGRKAAWVASKIGVKCGGSFRSMLATMVRFGILKRTNGGYAVA